MSPGPVFWSNAARAAVGNPLYQKLLLIVIDKILFLKPRRISAVRHAPLQNAFSLRISGNRRNRSARFEATADETIAEILSRLAQFGSESGLVGQCPITNLFSRLY
jgi:hypothetical protein